MKKTPQSRRISTEPAINKLYEKSIKVQGIVYIQNQGQPGKKAAALQVKPNNKILYHCYKRYKSYPYSFDYVYEENEEVGFYGPNFGEFNAAHSVDSGLDYMLYCIGTMSKLQTRELPIIEMLFYEHLAAMFDSLVKQGQFSMSLHFISISEDTVFDLIGQSTVQIRQTSNSDILFVCSEQITPTTPYQIYQIIKQTSNKRNKLMINSYYIIYGQILPTSAKKQKRKFIFVNSTKDLNATNRNWDNGSSLVLNKCILGLLNKMEGQSKQTYAPFRDSKITRILKPFLSFNARIDVLGFINLTDDQTPFSTLNLVKNLSRLKVPVSKLGTPQNPEIIQLQEKLSDLLKERENSKTQKNSKKSSPKISQVQNLLQQVRKNAKQQLQIQKKLNQIRCQIKLVRKRKQLNLAGLVSIDKSEMLEKLQQQQINIKKQKQKELLEVSDKINQHRIQTINKSISKVEKLKLLKQYYTMAMSHQKQQVQDFVQQQQAVGKFYEQRLQLINKSLKKSPKQLLQQEEAQDERLNPSQGKRRYRSVNTSDVYSLPNIISRQKKRVSYVKQKAKKGRVDYQHFLSKNIENYQSYSAPFKQ